MRLSGFIALLYAIGLAAGCGGETVTPFGGGGSKKGKSVSGGVVEGDDSEGEDDEGIGEDDERPGKVTKKIEDSGARFQAKDIALLRSSIKSCMGDGMMTVTSDMLLPADLSTPGALPDGKVRFLLPGQYNNGDDIVDKEKRNLVDTTGGARTGIAADTLTDTYLRSLETIANVVAHNCTAENERCQCGSTEQALGLLKRCLPGLDPETEEMQGAAAMLGGVCAEGADGMRKAIASFLASYAFASAR